MHQIAVCTDEYCMHAYLYADLCTFHLELISHVSGISEVVALFPHAILKCYGGVLCECNMHVMGV